MRNFKRRINRAINRGIFVVGALVVLVPICLKIVSQIPIGYYYWFGAISSVGLCLWLVYKFNTRSEKYINEKGYVVLRSLNELEHRVIAKQILGRNLNKNEIIHHINGKKTDNDVRNLCLMKAEKHEHFHAWLIWKKQKTGIYPPIKEQKRVLETEYGGILLETVPQETVGSRRTS